MARPEPGPCARRGCPERADGDDPGGGDGGLPRGHGLGGGDRADPWASAPIVQAEMISVPPAAPSSCWTLEKAAVPPGSGPLPLPRPPCRGISGTPSGRPSEPSVSSLLS